MTAGDIATLQIPFPYVGRSPHGRIAGSLIALVAGLGIAAPTGSADGGLEHRFDADGRETRFESQFVVAANADCVLHTLFAFEHLEAVSSGSATIELVDASESIQTVDFIYDGLFIRGRLRYRRALMKKRSVIQVELISGNIEGLLAPSVERSSGAYEVRTTPTGTVVRYEEHATFDESLLNFAHTAAARRKAISFMAAVREHLVATCTAAGREAARSAPGSQP